MAPRGKTFDWENIEREYRAGQLSVNEISKTYGISRKWIMKRATETGWTRNLAPKVHQEFKQQVLRIDALPIGSENEPTPPPQTFTDEEIVEGAANRKTEILKCHRRDISSLRRMTMKLEAELENPIEHITLYQRSMINQNLAAAMHKLIALERTAYALDDPRDSGGTGAMPVTDGLISELAALRRRVQDTEIAQVAEDNGSSADGEAAAGD